MKNNIDILHQIRSTLINEYDDFSRDDVQYDYDEFDVMTEDSRLWDEERKERYKNFKESIDNIDQLISDAENKSNREF